MVGLAQSVEEVLRQAEAITLAVAREFDRRSDETLGEDSLARKLGARKPWGAIETVTRTSAEDARRRVLESRALAKLPVIEEAMTAGALSRAQAEVIGAPILKTLHTANPADVDVACTQLLEMSQALPASAVAAAAEVWKAVLDPDGIEPIEKTAIEKRFLRLGKAHDGLVKLTGLLPIEIAATLRTVLDAYRNPRAASSIAFHPADEPDGEAALEDSAGNNDSTNPADGSTHGGSAGELPPPRDTRTREQQDLDTLHMIISTHARSGDAPTMGGAHPTVLVTVTRDDLDNGTGPAWIDGEAEPVSITTAKRMIDTGGYQEVELSPTGEILNLGRTQRCFTPQQRRALAARDKGCIIPAAPHPPDGAKPTTSHPGKTAAKPMSSTPHSCAGGTTTSSTTAPTNSAPAKTAHPKSDGSTAPTPHPGYPPSTDPGAEFHAQNWGQVVPVDFEKPLSR
ncbi:DUF222 domain-containing protein [Gryllotalpicola protaetiae]|uniref:DUF222 domain-containing protein n=1 Tax=Gryllotalpicola protaetiae TaxID=2419771 RepID=A0A387BN87_9MICO|nr:DUF222 domain-containing protein [Gryllotalpicola protaetiae]AYG02500.1 DUF222 domain-containing protein [Gryllotalpicola protaetiae]